MATARIRPIYHAACPNCGGPIEAERLEKGLVCSSCLSDEEAEALLAEANSYHELVLRQGRLLSQKGKLNGYSYLYTSVIELLDFEDFFRRATGSSLWSAQLTWAKRLLQGESLAIVAPTGVGKTTLLSVYALYRASEGAKVYYLLPTENLASQVVEKLTRLAASAGVEVRIVAYYSSLSRRRREEALARIENGDYDILVTTTGFLSRRWELLSGRRFDVVLVDDVDSVLRNSRNIDRLLQLLGFTEETIEDAYNLVKKKIAAVVAKATGNIRRYTRLLEEIKEIEARLSQSLLATMPGQLVIASATGRARGIKPKLFRELLGFEIGRVHDYTRSVANFYTIVERSRLVEETVEIVKRLGPGGLVFVAKRLGKETAKEIARRLGEEGVRAGLALAGRRVLDRFARGELDVLVGVSSYYGVIVRGIDMPKRVLYTVFVGVPSNAVPADKALNSPYRLVRAALELGLIGEDSGLVKTLARLTPGEQTALRIALANGEPLEGRLGELLGELRELRRRVLRLLWERLCRGGGEEGLVVGATLYRCSGGALVAVTTDAATYVQASGRASRMLGSRMTHGVSIVVEEDEALVRVLEARLRRFIENASFEPLSWERLWEELENARRSRSGDGGRRVDIETSLIIVESPTKARTIAGFFGRPVRRRIGSVTVYETTFYNEVSGRIHVAAIAASTGHVYDLSIDDEGLYGVVLEHGAVKPVYKHIKRCLNCGHQFSSEKPVCPRCGSTNIASKEEVVSVLRQLAAENEVVYIATDPDIEGEKIAYDLYVSLKPYARNIKRIELHAITRSELMRALASPRSIDKRMVHAQTVRRIEDRWIGFALSQKLWNHFGKTWLGAGRVQTPVLGWIIERYQAWKSRLGYNVYAVLEPGLRLRLHFSDRSTAEEALNALQREGALVENLRAEHREASPPPPFTTETLIYEASKTYGYPAQKTMRIAQELFEAGLITYHRTDSTHVSSAGMAVARQYLEKRGLADSFSPRSWGPPGHHEAIRPTRPVDAEDLRRLVASGELRLPVVLRESHYRLYDLIFRRFVASQMEAASITMYHVVLRVGPARVEVSAAVEAQRLGYLAVYERPRLVRSLAAVAPGSRLAAVKARLARGSELQLYSHGDVVALMKERGLGRPSTYAKTIDNIIRHGYVIESKYRKKLVPTRLGVDVYSYLEENYASLVSEERTRKLLAEIDAIARGSIEPERVIAELLAELQELLSELGKSGEASLGEAGV